MTMVAESLMPLWFSETKDEQLEYGSMVMINWSTHIEYASLKLCDR